jgi:hypothetical protein
MSELPLKAEVDPRSCDVAKVPLSDITSAVDLLKHLHGCEWFSQPRPEAIQCELCLLSGLDNDGRDWAILLRTKLKDADGRDKPGRIAPK